MWGKMRYTNGKVGAGGEREVDYERQMRKRHDKWTNWASRQSKTCEIKYQSKYEPNREKTRKDRKCSLVTSRHQTQILFYSFFTINCHECDPPHYRTPFVTTLKVMGVTKISSSARRRDWPRWGRVASCTTTGRILYCPSARKKKWKWAESEGGGGTDDEARDTW